MLEQKTTKLSILRRVTVKAETQSGSKKKGHTNGKDLHRIAWKRLIVLVLNYSAYAAYITWSYAMVWKSDPNQVESHAKDTMGKVLLIM